MYLQIPKKFRSDQKKHYKLASNISNAAKSHLEKQSSLASVLMFSSNSWEYYGKKSGNIWWYIQQGILPQYLLGFQRDTRSPVVKTDNMTCMAEFAFFCLLGSSKNIIKSTKFRSFITNNIEKGTRGVSSAEAVQCLSE